MGGGSYSVDRVLASIPRGMVMSVPGAAAPRVRAPGPHCAARCAKVQAHRVLACLVCCASQMLCFFYRLKARLSTSRKITTCSIVILAYCGGLEPNCSISEVCLQNVHKMSGPYDAGPGLRRPDCSVVSFFVELIPCSVEY